MATGNGFPSGVDTVVVDFGTAPMNSGGREPAVSERLQLTSRGETTDGFNVFSLRNPSAQEFTVTLTGPGFSETYVLQPRSDLVVCTDTTGRATFKMEWTATDGTVRSQTKAANQSDDNDFDPDFVLCFAAGTPIATPDGERAVETLKAGDLILTADGTAVPVKWIGYQTLLKMLSPDTRFRPVRFLAGALALNVPHCDLVVTGDHGILVDGVMVNAAALVNGTSIVRVPASELAERVTYYHVETENHDIILAAGAAAETFVGATNRAAFDNYAQYVSLFGEPDGAMPVLPYPRVFGPRQVPQRIRDIIEARAEAAGLIVEAWAA